MSSPSLSLVEQPESASESEVGLAYGAVRSDELPEQPLDGARAVKALLGEQFTKYGVMERVGIAQRAIHIEEHAAHAARY